jgi:L-alanine-DL-glutamate epimerase-like enolase superfamily enzyme
MKINEIAVFGHTLSLTHPYSLSGGRLRFSELDSTFVRLSTDAGIVGWGEGCPWGSTYLPAFPLGIRAGIEELAPALLGQDPTRPDVINRIMDVALPGHPYVKSALDVACYDITGKATDRTVADLLGGDTGEPVIIQSSIPTGTPEEMVASIESARATGYTIHSPKVGSGVVDDVARIREIGEHLAPGESVTFDANRAWIPDEAIRVMNQTEDVDAYFEQPCETYEENLQVRRATRQPIILDETIKTHGDVLRAHREHACEVIGLKVNRVGGLTKAKRIRDLCVEIGVRMNIEETGGSALADTGAVHLAQSTPAGHRRGTWLCHDMLDGDPIIGGARKEGGATSIPGSPGLGAKPDLDQLGDPVAVYRV